MVRQGNNEVTGQKQRVTTSTFVSFLSNIDELAKSQFVNFSVIPAKAEIQYFQ